VKVKRDPTIVIFFLQEKRQKRMKLAQQKSSTVEEKKVETFESLSEKQSNILKEVAEVEADLKAAQEALSNAKSLNKQVGSSGRFYGGRGMHGRDF